MTDDAGDLLDRYRAVHPTYEALADWCAELVKSRLDPAPYDFFVKGRAKDPAGFVLKALKKHRAESAERARMLATAATAEERDEVAAAPLRWADPIAAMSDKAGVRVIVSDLESVGLAASTIGAIEQLEIIDDDDKSGKLAPRELGYLGRHLQAKVADGAEFGGLEVEIQLHTKAQNAWADVSHPLTYKPIPLDGGDEVARRVMRSVALVSLFDDEIAAAQDLLRSDPAYRAANMFDVVEKAAVPWRRAEPNPEVSLEVLRVLENAYVDADLERFKDLIAVFVAEQSTALDIVFAENDPLSVDLLDQPEAIAIYERLKRKPNDLKTAWLAAGLPYQILHGLAEAFTCPYPD